MIRADALELRLFEPSDDEPRTTSRRQVQPVPALTSDQIVDALRDRHPSNRWVFLTEVRASSGYGKTYGYDAMTGRYKPGRGAESIEQRIDAWATEMWLPNRIVAYEVKVSRSDFLDEIKHPEKRAFALTVATEFWFATPARLVRPDEIPEGCGLVEVNSGGVARQRVAATPAEAIDRPSWGFVHSLLRNLRRTGFAQGPGHRGQCGGFMAREMQTGEYGTYEMSRRLADDEFCAKEFGHAGWCRPIKMAGAL